jgi:sialate O-acetylesterase
MLKQMLLIPLVCFIFLITIQSQEIHLKLPALYSSNMVLQQQSNVKIWGSSSPGLQININPSWGKTTTTTADSKGLWEALISTPKAGGPYTIEVSDKNDKITLQNVFIGEVWFCSGQSNMEMPLAGWPPLDTICGGALEVRKSENTQIRLFNIQKSISITPEKDCAGAWQVCNPASVKTFSATAYYFAKKLNEQLKIPVGVIESAWGGTPVESWTSSDYLLKSNEFTDVINNLNKTFPEYNEYINWVKSHPVKEITDVSEDTKWLNLDFKDTVCAAKDFNDSGWRMMETSQIWEQTEIGDFDGVIWFRKSVELPGNMAGKELTLSLGPIDDMDRVYFNGQLVGATEKNGYWNVKRIYTIPATLTKAGVNTLAVRVVDPGGGGGMWGDESLMFIQEKSKEDNARKISVSGEWKFLPVAEYINNKFYVFSVTNSDFFTHPRPKAVNAFTPSVLFNAMVYPVTSFCIKGAIWYQGEANVGRAEQYKKLFPLMIKNWRDAWNIGDFPFYFTQIAPYNYENNLNGKTSAELRDAQRQSLVVANTGMAVTLDIGNNMNIHPCDKQSVGSRLAYWALAKDYMQNIAYSGPLFKTAIINGNKITLQFTNIEGGLVAKDSNLKEFEIAGTDGVFYPAQAIIVNNEVEVTSENVKMPKKVRYCWHNGSEPSLFNKAGLPASGFITE